MAGEFSLSNGNGNQPLPLWARITMILGFPTVVAVFFLAQTAGWIPNTLASDHESIRSAIALHDKQQDRLYNTFTNGLRLICKNTARTVREDNACETLR